VRERTVKFTARVTIGIEKVLYLAASNDAFRSRLLVDREVALATARVRLSDVERTTLLGVPRSALETMIAHVSPVRHGKRRLMKTVAAAAISLAAGTGVPGCGEDGEPAPDADTADVDVRDFGTEGAAPDVRSDADWTEDADTADVDARDFGAEGAGPDDGSDPDSTPESEEEVP
jgi:hypothetical protein